MTLQGGFTPAIIALIIADFDEKPTWKDAEVLDGLDLGHFDGWGGEGKKGHADRREKGKEEKKQSRKKRKKKSTHAIACAMTESCEWRGQIWICLGATGTFVCRVA